MPLGSSNAFTPCMRSIIGAGFDMWRYSGFITPMPCSAEMEPRLESPRHMDETDETGGQNGVSVVNGYLEC